MSSAALQLQDVAKEYPGGVHALRGVSVEIAAGEQVAVVGPSGSGKTTMLTVLGTLERPTSGYVAVAGRDVVTASDVELAGLRAHEIGFVFQDFHLQDSMTALDNVANGMLYMGAPAHERREAARAALERVGLGHRLTHRPPQLSGGERQRVAIARALICEPSVLICDEVTSALDVSVQAAIVELLHGLQRDLGLAMLFVTHNLPLVRSIAQRVAVMSHGRIVELGSVVQILESPKDDYTSRLLSDTPSLEVALETAVS
jgi:putative ABC transport system ATP-binding protein